MPEPLGVGCALSRVCRSPRADPLRLLRQYQPRWGAIVTYISRIRRAYCEPILAALRSTHERGTPATPAAVWKRATWPETRMLDAAFPGQWGLWGLVAKLHHKGVDWSGERVEAGTYLDSMRPCAPLCYRIATCRRRGYNGMPVHGNPPGRSISGPQVCSMLFQLRQ